MKRILGIAATVLVVASTAFAQTTLDTVVDVEHQAAVAAAEFNQYGALTITVGEDDNATEFTLGGTAASRVAAVCAGDFTGSFNVPLNSAGTALVRVESSEDGLIVGSMAVACPLIFDPVDQGAADWTLTYFTDREHDRVFFTEADRDTAMLPAIADRMYLTGPEFFDGFTVHTHDGAAIDQVFTDARSNVMAYRAISTDGQRAYLAVPRSSLECDNTCQLGGAEVIYLHASRPAPRVVTHEHYKPKPPVNENYSGVAGCGRLKC